MTRTARVVLSYDGCAVATASHTYECERSEEGADYVDCTARQHHIGGTPGADRDRSSVRSETLTAGDQADRQPPKMEPWRDPRLLSAPHSQRKFCSRSRWFTWFSTWPRRGAKRVTPISGSLSGSPSRLGRSRSATSRVPPSTLPSPSAPVLMGMLS